MAARPTSSPEGYDLYLQDHAHLQRDYSGPDLFTAVGLLEKAVALDSTFALAYADLARANDWLYWFYFDRTEQRLAREKAAAERGVQLQPGLPEAPVAKAYYYYYYYYYRGQLDYDHALAELELARRAAPTMPRSCPFLRSLSAGKASGRKLKRHWRGWWSWIPALHGDTSKRRLRLRYSAAINRPSSGC